MPESIKPLSAADDMFHPPPTGDPMWSETVWYTFSVPDRRWQGYFYLWVRVNQQLCGGGVMLWDDQGHQPWDAVVWDNHWAHPLGELGDLRDYRFPFGPRVRCLKPLDTYELDYARGDFSVRLHWAALTEPHTIIARAEDVFTGHFDQPGHVTGVIEHSGETIAVDSYGLRDRSWGPRREVPGFRLGYDHGQNADEAFLAYSDVDVESGPISKGYLWRDGEMRRLVSGHRTLEYVDHMPKSVHISAIDESGRSLEAFGDVENKTAFMNLPWMLNWNCLTRWTVGSEELWGEVQDIWHLDRYRSFSATKGVRS